jgi:hypothetical protein
MLKLGYACSETRLALRDEAFGAVFEFRRYLSPNPPSFLTRKFAARGLTKNLKEKGQKYIHEDVNFHLLKLIAMKMYNVYLLATFPLFLIPRNPEACLGLLNS